MRNSLYPPPNAKFKASLYLSDTVLKQRKMKSNCSGDSSEKRETPKGLESKDYWLAESGLAILSE